MNLRKFPYFYTFHFSIFLRVFRSFPIFTCFPKCFQFSYVLSAICHLRFLVLFFFIFALSIVVMSSLVFLHFTFSCVHFYIFHVLHFFFFFNTPTQGGGAGTMQMGHPTTCVDRAITAALHEAQPCNFPQSVKPSSGQLLVYLFLHLRSPPGPWPITRIKLRCTLLLKPGGNAGAHFNISRGTSLQSISAHEKRI